jgi:enoyl-CoA hydratase/carnithine racemase
MGTGTDLSVRREGSVATVELARGKVNAIDVDVLTELRATLGHLELDDAVRAVVITGAGRVFSAGVDLRRVVDSGPGYAEGLVLALRDALEALFSFPKPTVAAVNGAAVAGGCIVACACDRRVMAEGARIGASELVVGVPFPVAALEILRHACGSRTEDLVMSGRLLDAAEALTVGLVHEVHPGAGVLERAVAVATELGDRAPLAYRLAKEQLRRPALERMRADARDQDGAVIEQWAAPHTTARLRAQLDRLAAAR